MEMFTKEIHTNVIWGSLESNNSFEPVLSVRRVAAFGLYFKWKREGIRLKKKYILHTNKEEGLERVKIIEQCAPFRKRNSVAHP